MGISLPACPASIQEDKDHSELVLIRSWARMRSFFTLVFAALCDYFVVMLLRTSWPTASPSQKVTLIMMTACAAFLTYSGLAQSLNETTFRLGAGRLSVTTRPLPLMGNRSMQASAIRRILSRRSRLPLPIYFGRGRLGYPAYVLEADMRDGSAITLIDDLPYEIEARYIGWRIESTLRTPYTHLPDM